MRVSIGMTADFQTTKDMRRGNSWVPLGRGPPSVVTCRCVSVNAVPQDFGGGAGTDLGLCLEWARISGLDFIQAAIPDGVGEEL